MRVPIGSGALDCAPGTGVREGATVADPTAARDAAAEDAAEDAGAPPQAAAMLMKTAASARWAAGRGVTGVIGCIVARNARTLAAPATRVLDGHRAAQLRREVGGRHRNGRRHDRSDVPPGPRNR